MTKPTKKPNAKTLTKDYTRVSPKRLKALQFLGLEIAEDFLSLPPKRYLDRSLNEGEFPVADEDLSTFVEVVKKRRVFGRKQFLDVTVNAKNFAIELMFFRGIVYYEKIFQPGVKLLVSGRLKQYGKKWQLVHPEFEVLDADPSEVNIDDILHLGRIIPIYKIPDEMQSAGITQKVLRKMMYEIAHHQELTIKEILPPEIKEKYRQTTRLEMLKNLHFPDDMQIAEKAREGFIFEEFYLYNALMHLQKLRQTSFPRSIFTDQRQEKFWPDLNIHFPFKFTADQAAAIERIQELSEMAHPYSVLLQGDVGSGKTAVVLQIATLYMNAGYQVAFMAPTEILATQHFEKLQQYLPSVFQPFELVVGSDKPKLKEQKLARLASGELGLIVGTHTLFQKDVSFHKLGLVIIDEQHRFGVEQREQLLNKGDHPDLIALTATPIPRTLAMSVFGNMESVLIKHKPAGRQAIDTRWFTELKADSIWRSVKKYVDLGQQAYIVFPLIDESENLDLNSCQESFETLSKTVFKDYRCGLLHGRLPGEEKAGVMRRFSNNEIQILFSTTVIEVGIDVPNATVMVIMNAERFGLSALHQLRGRVGRGSEKSFCILVSVVDVTESAEIRLQAMVESQDGFHLAEVDLNLRGPGEMLGLKQSGLPHFRLASFSRDAQICQMANQAVRENVPSETIIQTAQTRFQIEFEISQ